MDDAASPKADVGIVGLVPAELLETLQREGISTVPVAEGSIDSPGFDSRLPASFIVSGPLDESIEVTQRLQRFDPTTPVLLFADDPSAVRRKLILTPFVTASVSAFGPRDLVHAGHLIKDAIASARLRRGYSQTMSGVRFALDMEAGLAAPSAFLGPLLELAPIGIVLADPSGNVLAANPCAEGLAEDLKGPSANLAEAFSQQLPLVEQLLAATEAPVGPFLLEPEGADGRRVIETTSAAIHDGGQRRLLILMDDVTRRVEAERRAKVASDSLVFQASLLESQSEALADGVLVVDADGKMISFNRKFVEMWEIPESVIDSRSDEEAIRSVLDKVADPDGFTRRIAHLYEHPSESSRDEVVLNDGRTFERLSSPVRSDAGDLLGRMWFYRDITETRRREERLAFLAAVSEAASASPDLTHNLRQIGSLAVEHFADICLIYLVGDDGLIDRVELADRDPERQAYLRDAVRPFQIDASKDAGVGQVLRDGVPILATHADAEMMAEDVTDTEGLLQVIQPLGIESWVCVPLRVHRESIGAISLVSLNPSRRFGQEDVELALEVSRRVSVGIQTVRIAERERRIAETLQRSLLPQTLPEVPGLVISSHYAAGSKGMDVGGDWFEVMKLPDKKVLAVVGDVAGKGLRAAAVMGEIRMALRAYSIETSSPSEIVSRLNRLLMESEDFRMATLLCAVIDLRKHVVCFVSAGHPPPLLLDPDGQARFLSGGLRPPLGVPLHLHEEAEHQLPAGSVLLLYTDGVVERRDRAIDEGMEVMRQLVERSGSDPSSLCASVVASAVEGHEFADDVALLAIQLAPLGIGELLLDVTATPAELARVRAALERWLISAGAASEVVDDVVLAVNEASANAIEHAYGPGQGVFRVDGRLDNGDVLIEVTDQGRWRQAGASEHGRGISLMQALMDETSVERSESGTVVRLRKNLSARREEQGAPEAVTSAPGTRSLVRVTLEGEIDLARSKALTRDLLAQVSNDSAGLVLNLTDVTYIDSSGLRMLFLLQESLSQRRQELILVVPPASLLRRMLDLGAVPAVVNIAEAPPP